MKTLNQSCRIKGNSMLKQMKGLAFILLAFFCSNISYSQFNPGKLAVLVVGDGSAALSSSATSVFVKEFNISGGSQPGIIRASLPATATSGTSSINRAVTQSGTSTSEGYIGLSTDRNYLVVTGYNTTSGTASVASSSAATFPVNTRTVARIDASGTVDSKTTLNTTYSGVAIRSATTVNGTAYWTAGPNGICYIPDGNIAATTNLATTNTRVISNFNNQLYTTSGAGGVRLASVGSGLPTSGTPAITNLNGYPTNTGDPYSYVFIDLNGGGPDIVYVASLSSSPSGLLKYTSANNGSTWVAQGSLLGNIFGVTGFFNSCTGNVDLYITANSANAKPNSLYAFSDLAVSAGAPALITSNGSALSSVGTLLATAATNTAFGGVAFSPGTSFASPSLFTVSGGNSCFGAMIDIGLSDSEPGILYELKKDGATVSTLQGTGNPLSFGNQSNPGVYSIVAVNPLTGCSLLMSGESVIHPLPTVSISTSSNVICSGDTTNIILDFTGTGPWSYSINGLPLVSTMNSHEIIPVNPSDTTTYLITSFSDANCNGIAWSKISAGSEHSLAIRADGTLWSWGRNDDGQLGIGNNTHSNIAVQVGTANNWVNIAASVISSYAIKADGTLWAWGGNSNGRLGLGDLLNRNLPEQVGTSNDWKEISSISGHCLAIKTDGTLWAWGENSFGRLGDGTTIGKKNPVQIGTSTDWKEISAGGSHSMARKADGKIFTWGNNDFGQTGNGSSSLVPVQLSGGNQWVSISAGDVASMAIKSDGSLYVWGENGLGQLGTGNYTNINSPFQLSGASDWAKVSVSSTHTLGLKTNGTLWAWGYNLFGAFGNGTNAGSNAPVQVGTESDWSDISLGAYYSMALKKNGSLVSFGYNNYGQLADGTNTEKHVPVQPLLNVGSITVIVLPLPVVSFTGLANTYCVSAQPVSLTGIPAGGTFTGTGISGNIFDPAIAGTGGPFTITYSYTDPVTGCSNNSSQQVSVSALPVVSFTGLSLKYCISASPGHLTGNPSGGVFSGPGISGTMFYPETAGAGGPYNIVYSYTDPGTGCSNSATQQVTVHEIPSVSISAVSDTICPGSSTSISLGFTGTGPWDYSLNNGPIVTSSVNPAVLPVTPVVTTTYEVTSFSDANCSAGIWDSVATGSYHVLALKKDGSLWSWGFNDNGQLGIGNYSDTNRPVRVGTTNDWVKISAGSVHSMALKADGTLWAWGNNTFGRLGLGTSSGLVNTPQQVGTATGWIKVDAGSLSTMAIKSDGTLWGWGSNADGMLGDGTVAQRNAPVQAGFDTDWKDVSAGLSHTLGLKANGSLWGWGSGSVGQLGGATPGYSPQQIGVQTDWAKIIAGNDNSFAIKASGTAWGWGRNSLGVLGVGNSAQTNNPTQVGTAADWKEVSFTAIHTQAIKQNGTLWSWGSNQNGSFGTGNNISSNTPVQAGAATDWLTVSAGLRFGAGIRSDFSLWAWGINDYGQLGNGGFSDTLSPVQVPAALTSVTIAVMPMPVVSFNGLSSTYCANPQLVTLTGSPAGGVFSGAGISGHTFDPSIAGGGVHSITYNYTDVNGCSNNISQTVTVNLLPVTPVISGNLCAGSTLTVSPTNGIASLVWNLNGSPVSTATATGVSSGTTVAGGIGQIPGPNELTSPYGVSIDADGNIYVVDVDNHRVQKWAPGALSGVTVAGGNGDGAGQDQFSYPFALYVDAVSNIYVSDLYNYRIQKWAPGSTSGITVAGGNGQGSAANQIGGPYGVALDGSGNIYISDPENYRVQKWAPGATTGTTVAGGNGNGPAANQLAQPDGLCIDAAGNIYVADAINNRVQKWAPGATSGVTVAGGNGVGAAANQLNYPNAVTVDVAGNIYVTDNGNNRIQKWAPGATSGITVAGGNGQGAGADQFDVPYGLALDAAGNIYVADVVNYRVQKWAQTINDSLPNVVAGNYSVTVNGFSGCNASSVPVTVSTLCTPVFTTLNLTAFLEGFYYDINTMRANIYDLGISANPAETDTVTVNLWSPTSLANPEPDHTFKAVLHTDGTATIQFPSTVSGNSYYIAVKHRNHMETWSKLPVTFSSNTDYDFSDNLQKAYDDGVNPPMSSVAGNKFAFYGGDVNQDGTVDASDMADVDNDNAGFAFGYNLTDVNGDGATDASDISIIDNNQALFLFYARPY